MTFKMFANKFKVKVNNQWVDRNPNMEDRDMNHFKSTLKSDGKQMTLYFSQGYGITGEPTADSILNCLAMDASSVENSRNFEEWARDFGYDTDSRKAEKIYRACIRESEKLKKFLGNKYDVLMKCQE